MQPILSLISMIGVAALASTCPSRAQEAPPKHQPKPQPKKSNPLELDKTGLRWVLPFKTARERAAKTARVLMIKPVAFGTEASGGW